MYPTPLLKGRENYRLQWDPFKNHYLETAVTSYGNVTVIKGQSHGPNQTKKKDKSFPLELERERHEVNT